MDGVTLTLYAGLLIGLVLLLAVLLVLRSLLRNALQERRAEPDAAAEGLQRREGRLAEREAGLEEGLRQLATETRIAQERSARLDEREAELQRLGARRREALEETAGMSAADARQQLLADVAARAERDAALLVRRIETQAREEAESRAREIIATSIQRLAAAQTTESVVTTVALPEDGVKGRIIGRDGRNIRALEACTGVNVIVDDTPAAVSLSCFDPVRREVARRALESLVADGRIHPRRIEDACARAREEVDRWCVQGGEDAAAQVGVSGLAPELVALLGRLRVRTSYGQNVLAHLVESARLAGLLAAELGVDPAPVTRAALLHDIGKGLNHEYEGSHAQIGAEQARRFGEDEDIVHAIAAHHDEVEPRTVEAVLVQAADAMSGGRPGARRESAEAFFERLRDLERLALASEGVRQVFAMQGGRELRVMVRPESVDDVQSQVIARDIAKRVEQELTYPGQIRVTVIRESRAVETAR